MRLGQLARKLGIRQAEIVAYLETKNIRLEEDTNARLEDEHLALITAHFDPDLYRFEETPATGTNEIEEPVLAHEQVAVANEKGPESKSNEDAMQPDPGAQERIEVIKAPKVELKGLKVIGKIELPEPKKKEAIPAPASETAKETPHQNKPIKERRDRKGTSQQKHRKDGRSRKNPVALQREREAREAEEKRRIEAMQLKEKRTQYYYSKVRAHVPTKSARIVNEPVEQISGKDLAENPKTWWGRFLRWLTT